MIQFQNELNNLKSKITNTVLTVSVILLLPTVAVSLLRIKDTGFHTFTIFYLFITPLLLTILLFRKSISLKNRSLSIVLTFFMLGVGALFTYGLSSYGSLWFIISGVFALLLINKRTAIAVLVSSLIIYSVLLLLIILNKYQFNIDFDIYNQSINSWIAGLFGFSFVFVILIFGIGKVYSFSIDMITSLSDKTKELETEIQKSKLYEQKLHDSEIRYKTLSDITFEGMLIHKNGIATDTNRAFLELFGYNIDEVIGKNVITQFVHKEYTHVTSTKIKEIETGSYEVIALHKNGNEIPIEIRSHNFTVNNEIYRATSVRDISERKKAEEIIKENERKKTIDEISLAGSEIGLYEFDAKTENINYGPTAHKIYDLSLEKMPTNLTESLKLLHIDDQEKVENSINNTINSDADNWYQEYRIQKSNGDIVWIRDKAILKRDKDKNLISTFGTITNITKQKETEQNLRDTQKWLNAVLNNVQSVIFIKDIKGKYILVNKEYELLVGTTQDNILGKTDFDLFPKESAELLRENDIKIIDNGVPVSMEESGKIPSGKVVTYLSNKIPLKNSKGKVYALCGFGTNITALKNTEINLKDAKDEQVALNEELTATNDELFSQKEYLEKLQKELQKSKTLYKSIFDNNYDAITLSDTKGNYKYVNPAFTKITGYSKNDALKMTAFDLIPKGEKLKVFSELINSKKTQQTEIDLAKKGEEIFTAYLNGTYLQINNEDMVLIILRDITKQKENEINLQFATDEQVAMNEELTAINEELHYQKEQLEKAQNQLIQSEKMASIGLLSAGIAHEINNPINYVSSGMVGLKKCYNKLIDNLNNFRYIQGDNINATYESIQAEHNSNINQTIEFSASMFQSIQEGIDKTIEIIETMRVFARTSDDSISGNNMNEIIDVSLKMLNNLFVNRIKIEKNYDSNVIVNGSSSKLHQVILNILTNAIQAIQNSGYIYITTINNSDNTVTIKIKDTGCGIAKENEHKIFDPFFTTKDVGKGTGLGMYLTYNIIEQHSGSIKFISRENEGTEFIITLPISSEK